mmetsp:Transcript_1082/g.3195  ORF Transcript_1082/g.3195 Transcript_1082/m.3195 type:complete len:274 (+) Transcript_1082:245-1066(+)
MHNFILHPGKAFAKSYRIQSEKSSLSSLPRVIFKSFRITRITCNIAFSRPSTLSFDCMSMACVIFSFTMNGFKLWTFVAVWYGLVAIVSDLYTFGADLRSTVNAASSSSSCSSSSRPVLFMFFFFFFFCISTCIKYCFLYFSGKSFHAESSTFVGNVYSSPSLLLPVDVYSSLVVVVVVVPNFLLAPASSSSTKHSFLFPLPTTCTDGRNISLHIVFVDIGFNGFTSYRFSVSSTSYTFIFFFFNRSSKSACARSPKTIEHSIKHSLLVTGIT